MIRSDSPFFAEQQALEKKDREWRARVGVPESVRDGDCHWIKFENGGEWVAAKWSDRDLGWMVFGWELPSEAFLVGAKIEPPAS